jgi:hypothetical protein
MAAESGDDVHQFAPRFLLGLFDAEAERWGVEVRGLSREDLCHADRGLYLRDPYHRASHSAPGSQRLRAVGQTWGPEDPGPLRPAVLLAARPFEVGAHRRRSFDRAPCWESKGSGSQRSAPACMMMVSAYTIGEGGGW